MTQTQRNASYWQLKDYEYFRGTAQIIANEVLKVTATQPPTSHSYNAVMTRVYDLCAILSEREQLEQQARKNQEDELNQQENKNSTTNDTNDSSATLKMDCSEDTEEGDHDDDLTKTTASSMSTMGTSIPSSFSSLSSASSSTATETSSSSPPSSITEMMIPPHLFAALTHWVKAGHSRRGLEKFCVTSHVRTRPMAKAATVQAVLLAQDLLRQLEEQKVQRQQQRQQQDQNDMDHSQEQQQQQEQPTKFQIGADEFPIDNVPKEEVLRLVSERFSKTSRYYGTAIGHADAAAVGKYEHPLKN